MTQEWTHLNARLPHAPTASISQALPEYAFMWSLGAEGAVDACAGPLASHARPRPMSNYQGTNLSRKGWQAVTTPETSVPGG